jgi:hypothetical protein
MVRSAYLFDSRPLLVAISSNPSSWRISAFNSAPLAISSVGCAPHTSWRPLQKLQNAQAVAISLYNNSCRMSQLTVKSRGLAFAVHQLALLNLNSLGIQNRNLLPLGIKIASYKHHGWLLLIFEHVVHYPLATSIFSEAFFLMTSSQRAYHISYVRGACIRFS